MPTAAPRTHFGERTVRLDEKQGLVDAVFHNVADRYDLMNDLMSFGLHRIWKDILVAKLRPPRHRPFLHLDAAGGTGDVAFRVAAAGGEAAQVTVVDVNPDMLRVGAERAQKRKEGGRIWFVEGNAEALPLPDATFDGYTIAFGIRNVPRMERALAEAYRVLKRGGRFLCLEFLCVDLPFSTASTRPIPTPRYPRSARWWRATARPIAISSNRSASFRRPTASPTWSAKPGFRAPNSPG